MNIDYSDRIAALLKEMTIDEKIGQLRQCGPSIAGAFEVSFGELLNMMFDGKISKEEFDRLMSTAHQDYREEDIRRGEIGSFNGIGDSATINRLQKIALEESRLGIPLLFGYDVIHGFRTTFPIPLAESCAWDPDLWQRTARAAADEATAAGIHMTFAPMTDVARDARWGRICEGAGEDVLLNSMYGVAKVKGFQTEDLSAPDAMAACIKHFAAYGAVEAGKDYNRVDMSMQKLHEEYLPPYKACIEAGARAVMPAFNDINGVPCSANTWLLQDVLRKEWKFDGMTVSDANAVRELVSHGVAENEAEAAKMAMTAGVDMDMSSDTYRRELKKLVTNGTIPEELLDRAVANILRIKFELGLFDHPYQTDEDRESRTLMKEEYRRLALEAAQKSIVLLKNEGGILPLKKNTKLAVFGKLAKERGQMTGAWAIASKDDECVSLIDALDSCGADYIYDAAGDSIEKSAEAADVLILTLGENKEESGEAASRADIRLKKDDLDIFFRLKQTGKPVVAVLFNGRPLAVPELHDGADAILEAWYPGTEAGTALVQILFGKVNPSAKLTATFPYSTGQCPIYYAHINTGRPGAHSKYSSKYLDTPLDPLYCFGYGLSYTEYEYSNINVSAFGDEIQVTFQIRNIGNTAGDEITQCYIQDTAEERIRPVRQLKAFRRVHLEPGESKTVGYMIPLNDMMYYDWQMNRKLPCGNLKIYVGSDVNAPMYCELSMKEMKVHK